VSNPFTEHPHAAGQGYWTHLWFAMIVAGRCIGIGMLAALHAVFPFVATAAAGDKLIALADEIRQLRSRR